MVSFDNLCKKFEPTSGSKLFLKFFFEKKKNDLEKKIADDKKSLKIPSMQSANALRILQNAIRKYHKNNQIKETDYTCLSL